MEYCTPIPRENLSFEMISTSFFRFLKKEVVKEMENKDKINMKKQVEKLSEIRVSNMWDELKATYSEMEEAYSLKDERRQLALAHYFHGLSYSLKAIKGESIFNEFLKKEMPRAETFLELRKK